MWSVEDGIPTGTTGNESVTRSRSPAELPRKGVRYAIEICSNTAIHATPVLRAAIRSWLDAAVDLAFLLLIIGPSGKARNSSRSTSFLWDVRAGPTCWMWSSDNGSFSSRTKK